MNWKDYWVLYDTTTLHIRKRLQTSDDVNRELKRLSKVNPHRLKYVGSDHIKNITEAQWRFWRQIQKETTQ